jgi:hypothetical protein
MEFLEPDWLPLEAVLPVNDCADFMYMGHEGDLVLYKHRDTRRYLNIDSATGLFYRYTGSGYVEIDRESAIAHAQGP